MTSISEANDSVLGLSFQRRHNPLMINFIDFLRGKSYALSVHPTSVHVFGLEGDLEGMAVELTNLAREFDEQNGSLIANTLSCVWEFRECCKAGCEVSRPITDVEIVLEGPAFFATGQWKSESDLQGHRRLGQCFTVADFIEGPTVGNA